MRRRVRINDRSWTVDDSARIGGRWGDCDWDERAIRICSSAKEHGQYRETFIHEHLHAMFPWMSEDAVLAAAATLDKNMTLCGL
jgi:hypothetical protein